MSDQPETHDAECEMYSEACGCESREKLKKERDALREFVASMIRCRYPVCPTIDPSGYGWDLPRLNEVIDAAIDAAREAWK